MEAYLKTQEGILSYILKTYLYDFIHTLKSYVKETQKKRELSFLGEAPFVGIE